MEDIARDRREVILLGDLNAKSPQWVSPIWDGRGRYLADWLGTRDMIVHNTEGRPTFIRGNSTSFIDITLSTKKVAKKIVNWSVLDEETLSDHQYIYFELRGEGRPPVERRVTEINWETFRATMEFWSRRGTPDEITPDLCERILKDALQNSRGNIDQERGDRAKPYWWTEQIGTAREQCIELRRRMQRVGRRRVTNNGDEREAREEYNNKKKELKRCINDSKRRCWSNLCNELENDIWGQGYQIVMGKMVNRSSAELTRLKRKEIALALFPQQDSAASTRLTNISEAEDFTLEA